VQAARFDAAERWLASAAESGARRAEVAAVRSELQLARAAARGEQISTLAQEFDARLRQNRLVEPAADSAKSWLLRLAEADATHPQTVAARARLGEEIVAEARVAAGRADIPAAERWLREAESIGAPGSALEAVRADLASVRERTERASAVVSAAQLTRTRTVEPRYPDAARAAGQEGWVELEFTVGLDGEVSETRVLRAEPAGVFDSAAVAAVERWRFRPVERDGSVVTQRARVRLRFTLE
jgi:protein TonB